MGQVIRHSRLDGGAAADRRAHLRVSKPDLFVRISGFVYQPEDASLGGFAICPYDGPLWNGDGFEGELLEPNGTTHPFSGEVVTHEELRSKLSCRFVALSDDGFDALTRGISSQFTARNALEELERSGRASEPFIDRLKRMPNEILAQFDRQQLDAMRRVFDSYGQGRHAIDRRLTFRLFGRHYYVVLLAGRDKRHRRRLQERDRRALRPLYRLADGAARIVFVGVVVALVALPLYAIKTMAGVDFLQETGVSTLWKAFTEQIGFFF